MVAFRLGRPFSPRQRCRRRRRRRDEGDDDRERRKGRGGGEPSSVTLLIGRNAIFLSPNPPSADS